MTGETPPPFHRHSLLPPPRGFTDPPALFPALAADAAPPAEQPFHFPDERLCAAPPPGPAPALGEVGYGEPMDPNGSADEAAILNRLLEIPEIWEMISEQSFATPVAPGFGQGPDANASFLNMDLNQNFGAYTQDFSHYSDLQFNMMVNENHGPLPPEAQDGLSGGGGVVQVKTEEEGEEEEQ